MSNISHKLSELDFRQLTPFTDTSSDISYVEKLASKGYLLPDDYREFLLHCPLTGVFDRQIVFSGKEKSPWAADGLEVLETLYGKCSIPQNDLLKVHDQFVDQLPLNFLAIGEVTGANLVCLSLRKDSFGKVYVWDHEHSASEPAGLYLAADSFTEFVNSLRELSNINPPIRPTQLVKMHLSDSLKVRINELTTHKK
jgi:SMI1-KNR4 cell-wall